MENNVDPLREWLGVAEKLVPFVNDFVYYDSTGFVEGFSALNRTREHILELLGEVYRKGVADGKIDMNTTFGTGLMKKLLEAPLFYKYKSIDGVETAVPGYDSDLARDGAKLLLWYTLKNEPFEIIGKVLEEWASDALTVLSFFVENSGPFRVVDYKPEYKEDWHLSPDIITEMLQLCPLYSRPKESGSYKSNFVTRMFPLFFN